MMFLTDSRDLQQKDLTLLSTSAESRGVIVYRLTILLYLYFRFERVAFASR